MRASRDVRLRASITRPAHEGCTPDVKNLMAFELFDDNNNSNCSNGCERTLGVARAFLRVFSF